MSEYCERCVHTDAQIAAVTERLRSVEAERDEANATIGNLQKPLDHIAKLIWGDAQGRPFAILGEAVATQLSALHAELQRKDAALKTCEQALFDLVAIEGDQASTALKAARAALQPKEPPCPTA